jgi:hypothetical protein
LGAGAAQESELVFVAGSAIVILGNASPSAPFSGGASAGTVTFTIDMTKYGAGMYLLKQEDGTTKKIIHK